MSPFSTLSVRTLLVLRATPSMPTPSMPTLHTAVAVACRWRSGARTRGSGTPSPVSHPAYCTPLPVRHAIHTQCGSYRDKLARSLAPQETRSATSWHTGNGSRSQPASASPSLSTSCPYFEAANYSMCPPANNMCPPANNSHLYLGASILPRAALSVLGCRIGW